MVPPSLSAAAVFGTATAADESGNDVRWLNVRDRVVEVRRPRGFLRRANTRARAVTLRAIEASPGKAWAASGGSSG